MSLVPERQFEEIQRELRSALSELFPISNGKEEIRLENVDVRDDKDPTDVTSQVAAMESGDSWTVPVTAEVVVHRDGKEVARRRLKVLDLPRMTERGSFIHNGTEYQISNLFTRKAGVYHRVRESGDAVADFNLANKDQFAGKRLKISYDPKTTVLTAVRDDAAVPLFDFLRETGMGEGQIKHELGPAIFDQNKAASKPAASKKKLAKWLDSTLEDLPGALQATLAKTELYPETVQRTLGVSEKKVTADLMLRSARKLVQIVQGKEEPDNQEAMEFQRIAGAPELFADQLRKSRPAIERRVKASMGEKKGGVRSLFPVDVLQRPLNSFFSTSLANQAEMINPLQALAGFRRTTIMGPHGGIKSDHVVSDEAKLIDPSHLGYLDPIHTPEGPRLGVTLSVPLGAVKEGRTLKVGLIDAKTGKHVLRDPGDLKGKSVAFPDEYNHIGKSIRPVRGQVMAQRDGQMVSLAPGRVDYIIPSARALFGVTTNLVPFLGSDQGNRAMTASRQAEQAVPLKYREAPLVQVENDHGTTFERQLGHEVSRTSPVAGEVTQVRDDAVMVKDAKGVLHRVSMYRNYGSKASSLYDSTAVVKAGDHVKAGQVVADTTFTKDGVLALGTNLRTGYIPLAGYNFEDGIVISESAATKLTSEHLHKPDTALGKSSLLDRRKFTSAYPALFSGVQLTNVGDDGIIRVGSKVTKGDPLLLALHDPTEGSRGRPKRSRKSANRLVSGAITWDKDVQGVVTKIQRLKEDGGIERMIVHVRTEEPAQVGDKLVGRHGNKGVITRVMADAQMPYVMENGKKEVLDIALNPMGIPGRINLGQVLETAAGKIAAKRGKPYVVKNFDPTISDYTDKISKELKAAGMDPDGQEVLYDPETEKPFRQTAAVGEQYFYKLRHQVDKKVSARSGSGAGRTSSGGATAPYDINHAPSSGAPHGGQSLGELGMYALLAHGARENLHEMTAYKGEKNTALWDAIREGTPLPPPKVPFAYSKFLGLLNGVRVNVRRNGNSLQLVPFTEEQIRALAPKALPEPGLVLKSTTAEPIKGGLFDPEITGGVDGTRWSRFDLPEPMPNPVFEDAVRRLLDLDEKEFRSIVRGDVLVNGKRGGAAIEEKLKGIDVHSLRKDLEAQLKTVKGEKRNRVLKTFKIARALDDAKLDPTVYMMRSVPVIPPQFRPVTPQADGRLMTNDLNFLYKDVAFTADGLKKNKELGLDYVTLSPVRDGLYEGLKALSGLGGNISRRGGKDDGYKGVIDIISGKTRREDRDSGRSKEGFFRKSLLRRRQDFTARSTITVEPGQDLDEIGVPEKIAWTLYQPFAERELVREGLGMLDAQEEYGKHSGRARQALERAMKQRPILFKRDPALHKFNVMAFKPRLVRGSAIEMHPLATGGFNADFDGDAMALFLPISDQAAREATKLFPSNNLFSPTTGAIMHTPGHEALLGLYLLTKPGKQTSLKFESKADADKAYRDGKLLDTDIIRVHGHETTLGRLKVEELLPPSYRETGKKKLSEMTVLDKGASRKLLSAIGRHDPQDYGRVANDLVQLGNNHSYKEGFSVGLNDFRVVGKEGRDKIVRAAEKASASIRGGSGTAAEKEDRVIAVLQRANDAIDQRADAHLKAHPTNIFQMVRSGSRGDPLQLKQIVSTPGLVKDARDRVVPFLVPKSYSEGIGTSSYWVTLSGARKGTLQKTQGVAMPGYMTRLMINSTVDQLITEEDCGARDGVKLSVDSADVLDRYLAHDTRLGAHRYRAGSVVTPKMVSDARSNKKTELDVRSPTRCQAADGICKHCMGLAENGRPYDIGDNVGVTAAQALGEPSTQLSLNVFHQGGLAKGRSSESLGTFKRLEELLTLSTRLPFAAPLAPQAGRVTKISKAPQGGSFVHVGTSESWVPPGQDLKVKPGQSVMRGSALSTGPQNPEDVLRLRGLHPLQDYVTDQIQGVLKNAAPVRRRNIEVVVKAMTDVTQVEDAGDHPDWVPGDMVPVTKVNAWNRKAGRAKNKLVIHEPQVKGVNLLPQAVKEDWMARLNFNGLERSLTQAMREGWSSNLHGFHPVPGMAFGSEFNRAKSKGAVKDWRGEY